MTLHIYRTIAECDYDSTRGTYSGCARSDKGTPFIMRSQEDIHGTDLAVLIMLVFILVINILLAAAAAVYIYITIRNWYNKKTRSMPTKRRLRSTTSGDESSQVESGEGNTEKNLKGTKSAEDTGNCDGGTQHPPLTYKSSRSRADLIENMETI